MRLSKKKFWALLLVLLAGALGLLFFNRAAVLVSIGNVLLVQEEIKQPGDLIIPLRGGRGFERQLETFYLYRTGKRDKICIMKSLDDLRFGVLERFGIMLPNGQEQNRSVLIQLGVPETDIVVDHQKPGGGLFKFSDDYPQKINEGGEVVGYWLLVEKMKKESPFRVG